MKSGYRALGMQQNPRDACACLAIRKAARAITQFYDRYLQSYGLKPTQYSLLIASYLAGEVSITDLSHFMVMDRTTLTRNLKPLEKEGLLAVAPGSDRRTRVVTVTRKGVALLKKMAPAWESAQKDLRHRLGGARFDQLLGEMAYAAEATQ